VEDAKSFNKVSALIVGAGPAGLSAAITLKKNKPDLDVVVIDKAQAPGNHNLSGASLEPQALSRLLDSIDPNWSQTEAAKAVLVSRVERDDILFFLGDKMSFPMAPAVKTAKALRLGFGQMAHKGDYICSVSKLTAWLASIAQNLGVEVLYGFAAKDIEWDSVRRIATGVKLVDQGLDKEGHPQPNYLPGESITADLILLAEGCDGLLTEKFIQKAGLVRQGNQLYSVGVKELIKVSEQQYKNFGADRVVHAMGWPLWTPVVGPAMFGGGVMYPMGDNHIAVGMIVGLDYKYCDFNPQDALTRFKEHKFVQQFIAGGSIVEAGAKMIPEAGLYALPKDPATGTIGRSNVVLLGDSAGFVNMLKIKGLHNAIYSGIAAATAAVNSLDTPMGFARMYTRLLTQMSVLKEMESAKNFRQTVAKLGPLFGMPLSVLGKFLPKFHIEPDYQATTTQRYKLKLAAKFDKDTFTAMAATHHREDQPCHLLIQDSNVCMTKCTPKFGRPCIAFCPAGVYEMVHDQLKAANPSNCLHCKTCQRKCPYDNIRWTAPEGAGGPRYKTM
jgi:electron-transferring-flavoprotein dehydrogenase